jgi:transposase
VSIRVLVATTRHKEIMSMSSPYVFVLADADRATLQGRVRSGGTAHRDRVRAQVVLAADQGVSHAAIATDLRICQDTVRKWRKRFAAKGLDGLKDADRPGRPRRITALERAEVTALACTLPAETGLPLSRFSAGDLASEVRARGLVATISPSSVRRILKAAVIKPWQSRSWIFPRDPAFAVKASRVLDLYARIWQGRPLGPDEYVISADEKSQLQALRRRHRDLPPGPGRVRRTEFEYRRGGTLAYFAAYDVHRAKVIGQIAPKTGIEPFTTLVQTVMTTEPYASARRVFWVVDNGSSHNGQASIDRMNAAWPNATLVHLPIHASWLNQVEIYFSILQRKAISPNDFADLDALAARVLTFEDRYNTIASPFDWKYTTTDLNTHLDRLKTHQQHAA